MFRNLYYVFVFFSILLVMESCASGGKTAAERSRKTSVSPPQKEIPARPQVPVSRDEKLNVPGSMVSTGVTTNEQYFAALANTFPATLKPVFNNKLQNRVQIIYTQIDRDKNNVPHFTPYYYNLERNSLFPAGTTSSLPLACIALQKANELKMEGVSLYTTMITEVAGKNLPGSYNDPTTPDGKPTLSNYLQRLLLVNDTSAFNRLYEFAGQEYIARALRQNAFAGTQIIARLWENLSPKENSLTNPVLFYNASGRVLYKQPMVVNSLPLEVWKNNMTGEFLKEGKTVKQVDLLAFNTTSLTDPDRMLRRLFFPAEESNLPFFNLVPADRTFLQSWLGLLPRQSKTPAYGNDRQDAFDKYLYYGADNGRKDPRFRIYNISGMEYGQLTDVAYIADLDRKVEFLLSATVYCGVKNKAGIMEYRYKELGIPFLRDLGAGIYRNELLRKKNYLPDFSGLPLSE